MNLRTDRRMSAPPLSPDEFARRFEASSSVLWTLAAGVLGDRSRVEDVLQESALIGLRKLEAFEPGTSFTAWMGRVVRFVALNHARRAARRRTLAAVPELLEGEEAATPSPAPRLDGAGAVGMDELDLDDDTVAALRELKPTARACLLLKAVLELEYSEIGEALSIPAGTAMSHVHRARSILRARLGEREVPGVASGS